METLTDGSFPNARTIVIDPHGEYATALGNKAKVFSIRPKKQTGEEPLRVPFWALPFSELQQLTLGGLQPNHEATIRDQVFDMKIAAAKRLLTPPPSETLTTDSPVPFSIKRLWYELDKFERMTFPTTGNQTADTACDPEEIGDPNELRSDRYPAASPYNQAPYKNQKKRNIERHIDMMKESVKRFPLLLPFLSRWWL